MLSSQVFVVLQLLTLCCIAGGSQQEVVQQHYNVILLGATGDLATRYLWNSLYKLFTEEYIEGQRQFQIYACGRKSADEGRHAISSIMLGIVHCETEQCRKMKQAFVMSVQYQQLKTEKQYKKLGAMVAENTATVYGTTGNHTYEVGRMFYLAIPPDGYIQAADYLHQYVRPLSERVWVKLVIEKPFGTDYNSAVDLVSHLEKSYASKELYFVDHYLGKSITQLILPFRNLNKENYESLWNSQHIDQIEIALKESIDVKKRIDFYDSVGVVRDMMQNHGTELLTLSAMELPKNSGNISQILQNKISLLQNIPPLSAYNIITGQYADYVGHLPPSGSETPPSSNTPTYATVSIPIRRHRWNQVPFIVTSGKQLEQKASYVRILFKCEHEPCKSRQIVFYIGGDDLRRPPMIFVSKSLPRPINSPLWDIVDMYTAEHDRNPVIFNELASDMYQLLPVNQRDAYTTLIRSVYDAQRHMFVDMNALLESWKIWDPILQGNAVSPMSSHRIYPVGTDSTVLLDFTLRSPYEPMFVTPVMEQQHSSTSEANHSHLSYRKQALVRGSQQQVIQQLGITLLDVVHQSLTDRGVAHVGLSGGNSPIQLLQHLVTAYPAFPWQHVHIWLVDERCVPLTSDQSNFHMIDVHLLQAIQIPYLNIHPIPVNSWYRSICDSDSDVEGRYEAEINAHTQDGRLDFVLLGLGDDGHTASLFPNQPVLDTTDDYVSFSSSPASNGTYDRVTMTYALINRAHHINVLVLGAHKTAIVEELRHAGVNITRYPITGIVPTYGDMTWYIDDSALVKTHEL